MQILNIFNFKIYLTAKFTIFEIIKIYNFLNKIIDSH